MAIRQIRTLGDESLTKVCKPVKEMNPHTHQLINDMFDTMYDGGGCGLAAPQVGVRKQIFVMDVEDGNRYVLINPQILSTEGSQTGLEGCLSVPGKNGQVTRAEKVRVRALNESMEEYELEGEGLLARCILHEYDHLQGKLYVDLVEGELLDADAGEEEQ